MTQTIDITPTPRILRTLGDIPFDVWQCLAELADNSLDAFRDANKNEILISEPQVDIFWSREAVSAIDREIVIQDNGPGMTIETLQNAARAGYSNNDPINNLGLFGMGFNIATARLGEETTFLSATESATEWMGIAIDFSELEKSGSFAARIVTEPKSDPKESGTRIRIRRLRDGIFNDLKGKETAIRKRLEVIYSDILQRDNVEIRIQNKSLKPHLHCHWSGTRFKMYKGLQVSALQEIDCDLGPAYFDQARNRYLNESEIDDHEASQAETSSIVPRNRRLRGWIGIQRYSDTTDFGIDFIRNGRKILIGDKSLFGFENPDTGTVIMEYPVELASTVGGRIVGEVHVDYLLPTYQKNGFDTSNRAWKITIDALRGAGPILPKKRQALGYSGDNDSFIGILANAFRRSDPGTKCLALRKDVARRFYSEFRKGNPEYQSDDKWFQALIEEDRIRGREADENLPLIDDGNVPSADISDYIDDVVSTVDPSKIQSPEQQPDRETSTKSDLASRSAKQVSLSGKFSHDTRQSGFDVASWKINSGVIRRAGERVPCAIFQDGINIDFFYDDTHSLIAEYPITPKQLLLQALAERLATRDQSLLLQEAYWGLITLHLEEERINAYALRETAEAALARIKEELPTRLSHHTQKAIEILKSSASEADYITNELLDKAPELYTEFQSVSGNSSSIFAYVSEEGLLALIQEFPEVFMDGNVFSLPFSIIETGQEESTARFRSLSVEKITAYLKDIRMMLRSSTTVSKSELIRYSNTIRLFTERLK